jgi:hypothetical protein
MRAIRAASAAALLGFTALTLSAPAASASASASADDENIISFGFSVTPPSLAPGSEVTLKVTKCDETATASSEVFDTVTLDKGQATATVDSDAQPNTYPVTFTCGDEDSTADLTVSGASQPTHSSTPAPVQNGVKAGAGGSLGDFDTAQMALGAALIAGSVGTAFHMARRRSGEH